MRGGHFKKLTIFSFFSSTWLCWGEEIGGGGYGSTAGLHGEEQAEETRRIVLACCRGLWYETFFFAEVIDNTLDCNSLFLVALVWLWRLGLWRRFLLAVRSGVLIFSFSLVLFIPVGGTIPGPLALPLLVVGIRLG